MLFTIQQQNTPLHLFYFIKHFFRANELRLRRKLHDLGLTQTERMQSTDKASNASDGIASSGRRGSTSGKAAAAAAASYDDVAEDEDNRCDTSKKICYLSMVSDVYVFKPTVAVFFT